MADKNDERKYNGGPKVPLFADEAWGTLDCAQIILYEHVQVKVKGRKEPDTRRRAIPQTRLRLDEIIPDKTTEGDLQEAYNDVPIDDYYIEARDFNGYPLKGARTITLGYTEENAPTEEPEAGDPYAARVPEVDPRVESLERELREMRSLLMQRAEPPPPSPPPAQDNAVVEMIKSQGSLLQAMFAQKHERPDAGVEQKAVDLAQLLVKPDNDALEQYKTDLRAATKRYETDLGKRDDELAELRRERERDRAKHDEAVRDALKEQRKALHEEFAERKGELAKAIAKLEAEVRDLQDAAKVLRSEHREELKTVRDDHREVVRVLRVEYDGKLAELRDSAKQSYQDLRDRGSKDEQTLKTELDHLRMERHQALIARAGEVSAQRAEHDRQVDALRKAHDEKLADVRTRLEKENDDLRKEVIAKTREIATLVTPDEVKSKIEEVKDGLASIASKDDPAWLKAMSAGVPMALDVLQRMAERPPAPPPQPPPQVHYVQQYAPPVQQLAPPVVAPAPTPAPAPVVMQPVPAATPAPVAPRDAPLDLADLRDTVTLAAHAPVAMPAAEPHAEPAAEPVAATG